MEENSEDYKPLVVDQTKVTDPLDADTPYISPEVAAAQAGERVEMGVNLVESDKED